VHRAAEEGVARQIVDYASKAGVDLIVISSHGRTGVDRWVHGSVTEKVLGSCGCNTLVIRAGADGPA
jgi:nucleotide-binding universal stress UspA family protein